MKLIAHFRTMLFIAAMVSGSAVAATDEEAISLAEILGATAIDPPQSVRFREERHNPMLKEPMVLTGTLEYLERGTLRKKVETPFMESYLVEPGQISVERESGTEIIRGNRGKFISGFLGGIESVLAGDAATLEASFQVNLDGTRDSWTLVLTPRSKRLAKHLQNLEVTGGCDTVEHIRVQLDEEFHVMELLHDDLVEPAPAATSPEAQEDGVQ